MIDTRCADRDGIARASHCRTVDVERERDSALDPIDSDSPIHLMMPDVGRSAEMRLGWLSLGSVGRRAKSLITVAEG
jgi:hypothetical protein